jgi:hypothetical protein
MCEREYCGRCADLQQGTHIVCHALPVQRNQAVSQDVSPVLPIEVRPGPAGLAQC